MSVPCSVSGWRCATRNGSSSSLLRIRSALESAIGSRGVSQTANSDLHRDEYPPVVENCELEDK